MVYLKGLLCPECGEHFAWFTANDKKFFDLNASLKCPHCNTSLKYPEHLRSKKLYVQGAAMIFLFIATLLWSAAYHKNIELYIVLAYSLAAILWIKTKIKLKRGYIIMVTADSE